jgi:hypothetical protein
MKGIAGSFQFKSFGFANGCVRSGINGNYRFNIYKNRIIFITIECISKSHKISSGNIGAHQRGLTGRIIDIKLASKAVPVLLPAIEAYQWNK